MRDQDDAFIRRVRETLRAPVQVRPTFTGRVMAAVRAAPARGDDGRLRWLVRPRTLRVSPLAALALAAAVAAFAVVGARDGGGRADAVTPPAALPTPVAPARLARGAAVAPTRFTLVAPGARSVAVVGDFNDWDATSAPLARAADGAWVVTLPLAPGRYEYGFVVDGARVVADPAAAAVASDFGAANSVVTVGGGAP